MRPTIKSIIPLYFCLCTACVSDAKDPCGESFFCYQGNHPLEQRNLKPGTEEALQKMGITLRDDVPQMERYAATLLNALKEPPLRAYVSSRDASDVRVIRCSLFPSIPDSFSVTVQILPDQTATIHARRYQKARWERGNLSAPSELHTAERHLMPDEIKAISEAFELAIQSGARTPRLPVGSDDIFMRDGDTWFLEALSPQGYLASVRMNDKLEPEFRGLCQKMIQMSSLSSQCVPTL